MSTYAPNPNMQDLEKTTISVKTFAIAMWTVVGGLSTVLIVATMAYMNIGYQMAKHSDQLDTITKQNQLISSQYSALAASVGTQQIEIDTMQKKMDGYRPYKWSVIMMKDYNDQLHTALPNVLLPSPVDIQHNDLPYTP